MTSGNFLIGDYLSHRKMEDIQEYVFPSLIEAGIIINDRLLVPSQTGDNHITLLVSLTGEGNLERTLNGALIKVGEKIEAENLDRIEKRFGILQGILTSELSKLEWDQQTDRFKVIEGVYSTLGIYQADDTASKLFPVMAQKYLAQEVKQELEELDQKLDELGERFSNR